MNGGFDYFCVDLGFSFIQLMQGLVLGHWKLRSLILGFCGFQTVILVVN